MSETFTQAQVEAALGRIPYARYLGVRAEVRGDELTCILPYRDDLIGNPTGPFLHGGVIGAFMELTAITQLSITQRQTRQAKTIDIGIDYLRPGKPADLFARAQITKLGRRVANARVEAWQGLRADPVATLHGHFLVAAAET